MTSFVGLHNRIYLAHLDLSGLVNNVNFGTLTTAMIPSTTFNDGGYTRANPGLMSGDASLAGFQDYTADVLDDEVSIGAIGSQYAFTVVPNPTGTVAVADPCWMSRGTVQSLNPMAGAKGDMAGFELGLMYDTAIVQAKVAHPLAARTATGTGTAVAQAGPTAAQKLYAAIHVTAYSGLTNVVFKIQSDDNSGFSSATDRITFTTVTGTTSQFSSVAGDFSTETHLRVSYTVTGTGSISFVAAFGVI